MNDWSPHWQGLLYRIVKMSSKFCSRNLHSFYNKNLNNQDFQIYGNTF